MTPKRKRLWLLVASLAVLGVAATLVLTALNDNIVFFYSPTQVAEKKPGPERRFRCCFHSERKRTTSKTSTTSNRS